MSRSCSLDAHDRERSKQGTAPGSVVVPLNRESFVKQSERKGVATNQKSTMAAFTAPGEVANPIYIEDADPYPWPFNGNMQPSNTCIIVIGTIVLLNTSI